MGRITGPILAAALMAAASPAVAAPEAVPPTARSGQSLLDAVVQNGKSVLVVTRAKSGRLPAVAAAPAISAAQFSAALTRTFQEKVALFGGHATPRPLPPQGPLASGFVAKVRGFGGRCGFAIGGLDYSGKAGVDGLDASAALIFCADSPLELAEFAAPGRIAAKIAGLPEEKR